MKKLFAMLVVLGVTMVAKPAMAADEAESLYKSKCQVCHGADGKGSAAGQKLGVRDFHSPEVAKESDAELAKITKEGNGKMPKFESKLTDEQIQSLIKYIRSLK
jgi:cytochrome c6